MPRRNWVNKKAEGKRSSPINHKSVGTKLRRMGLLPAGYRLNDLTKPQKDRITRLGHRFSTQLNHPEHFKPTKVKGKVRARLKEMGVPMKGSLALLQKHGSETIRIEPKRNRIVREYEGGRRQITELEPSKNIYKEAEKLFANLKRGEYVTLQVGDKHPFHVRLRSMKDFRRYKKAIDINYGRGTWKELNPTLVVVKVGPESSEPWISKPTPSRTAGRRRRSR